MNVTIDNKYELPKKIRGRGTLSEQISKFAKSREIKLEEAVAQLIGAGLGRYAAVDRWMKENVKPAKPKTKKVVIKKPAAKKPAASAKPRAKKSEAKPAEAKANGTTTEQPSS